MAVIHLWRFSTTAGGPYQDWSAESPTIFDGNDVIGEPVIVDSYGSALATTEDGRQIVMTMPQSIDRKIRYLAFQFDVPTSAVLHESPLMDGGFGLQGFEAYVCGAVWGDTVSMNLISDGTVDAYGPEGTLLRTFGSVNAPIGATEFTWEKWSAVFPSAAEIPAGANLQLVYNPVDSETHAAKLSVNLLIHI